MGMMLRKAGDWGFKALTASLGVATLYLAATFSVNVFRGLSWHNSQSVENRQGSFCRRPGCLILSCSPLISPSLQFCINLSILLEEAMLHSSSAASAWCLPFTLSTMPWKSSTGMNDWSRCYCLVL
ncbi:hypothetical protein MLD38_027947 [Melastoma candidum]|uniref:Uncharacterized protein n=1 Tax=Melastoma candidum TaxID=119954 RepID=A0ACB9N1R1_9MYRT|nr:hypothetical protein MLD38_027947 [Melastoma candidum]